MLLDERLGLLGTVLEELDADQRELQVLYEGEKSLLGELAKRQGLTANAVKGTLKRTRQTRRARLLEPAEQLIRMPPAEIAHKLRHHRSPSRLSEVADGFAR